MSEKPTKHNRYYLMRHGESLANRNSLIVSTEENAIDQYGLTTKGAEQVMQAALQTRLDSSVIIVSSDYKRAKETSTIMHSVLSTKHDIVYEPLLRERNFGKWELTDQQHYQEVWNQDLIYPQKSTDDVESVMSTLDRGEKVIEKLESTYQDKSILLVSHGDVLQILFTHYHGMHPRFHRSLASIANADIRALIPCEIEQKRSSNSMFT